MRYIPGTHATLAMALTLASCQLLRAQTPGHVYVPLMGARMATALRPQSGPSHAVADPLPEGEGKAVTKRVCSGCHSVNNFAKLRYTEDRWNSIIQMMLSKGMDASDEDLATITKYLVTCLGPPSTDAPASSPSATTPPPTPPHR